MPKQKGPYHNI